MELSSLLKVYLFVIAQLVLIHTSLRLVFTEIRMFSTIYCILA